MGDLILSDAIVLAIEDLENTLGMKWQKSGNGTKERVIKAFSQKEVSPREFLGYAGSDGLRHLFGRGLSINNKPKNKTWEVWILERIGLYYCNYCDLVHNHNNCTIRSKTRKQAVRENVSSKILEYLQTHPCEHCNETNPVVLEFDHKNPEEKSFSIGDRSNRTWDTVYKEIQKCRVLCANCHRKYTAMTQSWHKYKE
jgi:hypothetical protein